MGILWLIIKIILIILLAILVLVFAVVGIVLVAPIRYEAYLAKYETLAYHIKFTYLLGIKGNFYLEGQEKNHKVSAFGKILYKDQVVEEASPAEDKQEKIESNIKESKNNRIYTVKEYEETNRQKKALNKKPSKTEDVKIIKEVNQNIKQSIEDKVEGAGDKVKDETIQTINGMSYAWVKRFISDKNTYSALKEVLKCIWSIIRYISPYEWSFELVIGEDEPADTGETIAKLTMLYPLYYQHGIIRGNYEKKCLEGGFLVKGKFRLGKILFYFFKCILNKQVKDLIKLVLRLRKDESHGE